MKRSVTPLIFGLALVSINAHAQLAGNDVLEGILWKYQQASSSWASTITAAASFLFWTLTAISLVWTFGFMALRKADVMEFFAEFFRFTLFTGFFWWALTNGPSFATSIIDSLRQLASTASGMPSMLTPSNIVDIGLQIFNKVVDQSSLLSPIDSACGILMSAVILVVLGLVGVNMLILLVTGWFLSYAGIFFLGFGGSRWTSEMAITYYKTVLGVAAQLLAITLLVGIGKTFVADFYNHMSAGVMIKELAVMLLVSLVLLSLVNEVPARLAGIVSGGAASHSGFGAGAAAVATAGTVMAAAAKNIAGGTQAIMAAAHKASENMTTGSGMFSNMGINEGKSGGASLAAAMGDQGAVSAARQAAGITARFGADMGMNLAKGSYSAGMEKMQHTIAKLKGEISETAGGKIAQKIASAGKLQAQNAESTTAAAPSFGENSLSGSGEKTVDKAAEIATFRDRKAP